MTLELLLGIDLAKKFDTKFRFHKSLNLKNPQTLSSKPLDFTYSLTAYLSVHLAANGDCFCNSRYVTLSDRVILKCGLLKNYMLFG